MKTSIKFLTLGIAVLFAQYSYGQIANSAHDFSTRNWNNTTELCIVCHTPHNAVAVAVAVTKADLVRMIEPDGRAKAWYAIGIGAIKENAPDWESYKEYL